jgi:hypothetical protein
VLNPIWKVPWLSGDDVLGRRGSHADRERQSRADNYSSDSSLTANFRVARYLQRLQYLRVIGVLEFRQVLLEWIIAATTGG